MLAVGVLARPLPSYAYIDPGLGGQLFQLLYVIGLGAVMFIVSPILFFWKNIRARLGRMRRRQPDTQNERFVRASSESGAVESVEGQER